MSKPPGFHKGDWLATCFQCGQRKLASTLRKHWQGYWVCPEHWEERHPQDFVRGVQDIQTVPWSQPQWLNDNDIAIAFCTISGRSAVPAHAIPGCLMPGNPTVDLELESPTIPPLCDIYEIQGVPGWAGPGCAIPSEDPFSA
jgi:hypothetical protein